MKFIVDQQLPPALARWLTTQGHDAEHVREIGLRDADDRDIWACAESIDAGVITKDEDFVSIRLIAGDGPSIVWLRIGNATTPTLLAWLESRWPDVEAALVSGKPIIEVH